MFKYAKINEVINTTIIEIPFGILIITLIVILFMFKKAYKEQKNNNIICIFCLILLISIIFVLINGFGYPCTCGCGSEEIDWGIKAIISLFTKNSSYILIDTFPYSKIMITTTTAAAFTIIKAIKYKQKRCLSRHLFTYSYLSFVPVLQEFLPLNKKTYHLIKSASNQKL